MASFRCGAMVAFTLVLFAPGAEAQDQTSIRVARAATVREQPRGDSVAIGRVNAGDSLEVLERRGNWFLVLPPAGTGASASWKRGWLHATFVEGAQLDSARAAIGSARPEPAAKPKVPGRFMMRGFGHGGGTLFDARDSFDALMGNWAGTVYGGGGQVVFPNGTFLQVSIDRYEETGTRALVSGEQIFTLETPTVIQITPIQFTVGYRATNYGRSAPYFGLGAGWHKLTEGSPSLPDAEKISESGAGFHLMGGVEYSLARWLGVAGEVQWATVPKVLGETGISAVFEEDDLGGATFRFKFIVGF